MGGYMERWLWDRRHAVRGLWRAQVLHAAVIALALAIVPVTAAARAGETAQLKLGIVGADEFSRSGASRGVKVIELFGPGWTRGGLRRGDVVVRLDGRRVHDGEDLGDGWFSVEVLRRGELREMRVPRERSLPPGNLMMGDRRFLIRNVVRDVRRNVRRDVIRDVRPHRLRDVWGLRDDRAQLPGSVDRLRG